MSISAGLAPRLPRAELLRAGHSNYVINDEAIAYMRERAFGQTRDCFRLLEHPARCFADQAAWISHLDELGISALKVNPDPVVIATEGALWGSVKAHGFLADTVIVSDDAGQFDVGQHALCWVQYLESDLILGILSQRQWIGALSRPELQINSESALDRHEASDSHGGAATNKPWGQTADLTATTLP